MHRAGGPPSALIQILVLDRGRIIQRGSHNSWWRLWHVSAAVAAAIPGGSDLMEPRGWPLLGAQATKLPLLPALDQVLPQELQPWSSR